MNTAARPASSQCRSSATTKPTNSTPDSASSLGCTGETSAAGLSAMAVRGTSSHTATNNQNSMTSTVGAIMSMKPPKLSPVRCHRYRFCGCRWA